MNAKYYPVIRICREFSLIKKRAILPFKLLFRSKFIYSESYYPEMPQKSRLIIALELLWHILIYGCIEYHYFSYGLDIKGLRCGKDYLDDNWFLWKCAMLNTVQTERDYTCILRDKELFATLLANWGYDTPQNIACLKRNDDINPTLLRILSSVGSYFCKPIDGQCGEGAFNIRIIKNPNSNSIFDYYMDNELLSEIELKNALAHRFSECDYLIQTYVEQHPIINKIYDKSINTIRLVTVYNPKMKTAVPLSAVLRVGANGNVVDNWAKGGLAIGINLKNGILKEYAFYKYGYGTKVNKHPDTNILFKNMQIPFFNDALEQAINLHNKLQNIRVIGWDIAITSNGPIFIEGNDNPEIAINQETNCGYRNVFLKLIS